MSAIRALILDFDGVILESNDLKTRAFARVFAQYPAHADTMMAYHRTHVSASRFQKFEHLVLELLGGKPGDPRIAELAEAFSAEMLRQVETCLFVPGAQALLARLAGRIPIFLASVTPQEELESILRVRGLTGSFDRVYGCPPWTKASAVADIVSGIGGSAGVVFIGDSANDQRAAAQVGVEFLARNSGLPFDQPAPPQYPDLYHLLAVIEERL